MDSPKPPNKAANLLNDLESIRALLDGNADEPPLLTESLDPNSIPLLSEVVEHRLAQRPQVPPQQPLQRRCLRPAQCPRQLHRPVRPTPPGSAANYVPRRN